MYKESKFSQNVACMLFAQSKKHGKNKTFYSNKTSQAKIDFFCVLKYNNTCLDVNLKITSNDNRFSFYGE